MGQLVESVLPDGNKITAQQDWTSSGPSGTVFFTSSTVSGQGTVTKYYNAKGQLLQEEAPGALNKTYKTDYEYYSDGKLYRQYLPYNSTRDEYVQIDYDGFGRVIEKTTPQGNIYITYTGKTVRTETPSGWSKKTVDDAGLLDLAEDDGGSISYTYYSSGLPHEISYGSNVVSMQYDIAGNRTSLTDPNLGTESAQYNAFGELTSSTNPRGITTTTKFDDFGRMEYFTADGETTTYNYNTTSGVLESITGAHTNINYAYDSYMRMTSQTEHIGTYDFVTSFTYNALGQVETVTYPGGYSIENEYDNYGSQVAVKNASTQSTIWSLNSTNNIGQVTNYSYGNGISTALSYDSKDRLSQINAGSVFNYGLTYSDAGNLTFRDDLNKTGSITEEQFAYDNLNRMTYHKEGYVSYDANGNITYQDGLGDYEYNGSRPNAVTKIVPNTAPVQNFNENISYTWFDKVDTIADNDNNYKLAFTYGPDMQRKIMKTYENGAVTATRTKYYSGAFEKVVESDGSSKEYTYISAGTGLVAVNIKESTGTENLYYVHSDQQGSIMALSDQSGTKVEEYSYNAWGVRRNPDNWNLPDTRTNLILDRGYTGHEHLDHFGLINMNGRVYDAVLGRFLSPDPVYTSFTSTQRLNKYSYVLNNPLKYIDPSGYIDGQTITRDIDKAGSGMPGTGWGDAFIWNNTHHANFYEPGSRGYSYSNGYYTDNATGQRVDWQTAINGNLAYWGGSVEPASIGVMETVLASVTGGNYGIAIFQGKNGGGIYAYDFNNGTHSKIGNNINGFYEFNSGYTPNPELAELVDLYNSEDATSGGGDGFHYGKIGSYATWTESAGFAVVQEAQHIAEINRQVRAANSLSLWKVTAKDIKYFKQGSKWIGFAGPVGDVANIGLIITDASINGFTYEHFGDLVFGVIGFVPLVGDGIALLYMVGKETIPSTIVDPVKYPLFPGKL